MFANANDNVYHSVYWWDGDQLGGCVFTGGLWRIPVLLFSLLGHWLWFSQDNQQEQTVSLSGGAQSLPIAVSFSIASVAATVPKPREKKPVAEVAQKPEQKSKPLKKPHIKELPGLSRLESQVQEQLEEPAQEEPKKTVEQVVKQDQQARDGSVAAQAATAVEQPPGLESIPVVKDVSYRQPPAPPVYPKTALRRRQQGEVWVQALVSPEGITEQVEVVRSSGVSSLDDSALRAVSGWVFEAANLDGRPIRAWIEVPVAFELRR